MLQECFFLLTLCSLVFWIFSIFHPRLLVLSSFCQATIIGDRRWLFCNFWDSLFGEDWLFLRPYFILSLFKLFLTQFSLFLRFVSFHSLTIFLFSFLSIINLIIFMYKLFSYIMIGFYLWGIFALLSIKPNIAFRMLLFQSWLLFFCLLCGNISIKHLYHVRCSIFFNFENLEKLIPFCNQIFVIERLCLIGHFIDYFSKIIHRLSIFSKYCLIPCFIYL